MRKERERADRRQRSAITTGIAVVVIALIAGGAFAINKAKKDNAVSTTYVAPQHVNKDFGITYDQQVAAGKKATDPVKVIMYEDFQCPACQAVERESGAFLKQAVVAGDITIEWRPVSFLDSSITDDYSSRALNAALCVLDTKDVKTYAAMHDILYIAQSPESGPGLTNAKLNSLAEQAGSASVSACINSRKFDPWLRKASKAWQAAGYTGTPTIVIDGKQVVGPKQSNGQTSLPRIADIQKAIATAKAK